MKFQLDSLSFLFGFISATLLWFIFGQLKRWFPDMKEVMRQMIAEFRLRNLAGIESNLRQSTIQRAQKQHLAASIFSLDEILIEPQVLGLPPEIEPGKPGNGNESRIFGSIPFLPDAPELASQLGAPRFTLPEVLRNNAHVAILGLPGSGKTTALASLASKLCRKDSSLGTLVERYPLFVHILDIDYRNRNTDPLEILTNAIVFTAPASIQSKVPSFISTLFKDRKPILLLDGLDELPPTELREAVTWIDQLITRYKSVQMVVTASPDYFNGLYNAGFVLMPLASWNPSQTRKFIEQWSHRWTETLQPIAQKAGFELTHSRILSGWLKNENMILSPLEWTMKVWGTFAGDLSGPTPVNAVDSYVVRQLQNQLPIFTLIEFSNAIVQSGLASIDYRAAEVYLSKLPAAEIQAMVPASPSESSLNAAKKSSSSTVQAPSTGSQILSLLTNSGFLTECASGAIRFSNPFLCGYLASYSEKTVSEERRNTIFSWSIFQTYLHYSFAQNKLTSWIDVYLSNDMPPLYRVTSTIIRFTRDVEGTPVWKTRTLRLGTQLLQNEALTMGTRCRILNAFITTNDPSLPALLKQFFANASPMQRQLAALGSGAIVDKKSVRDLTTLLSDPIPQVNQAACIAIANLGNKPAEQAIVSILLKGEENLRLVAMEALAARPEWGTEIIKEAAASEDLLVRRVSVFGLSCLREDWVKPMLEKMAIEDGQWVVRNAAGQAIEQMGQSNPHLPINLPDADSAAWVISFAAKSRMGLVKGEFPLQVLFQALKNGSPDEKMASLSYLQHINDEGIISTLYENIFRTRGEMGEASLRALWYISASGARLPSPVQFGYA